MLQFCSVSNSLSHKTLSKKVRVYFSKKTVSSLLLCRRYDLCMHESAYEYTTIIDQKKSFRGASTNRKLSEINVLNTKGRI